ncbi:MAG: site-specific recombinase [Calothrix sp. SM1_5_4]|nr:site-specific recombinase [Calothrix sp. SM1_5_4]
MSMPLLDGKGEEAIPLIRESLSRCEQAVVWIRSRRNVDGASLGLTYRLMKIQEVVHRMQLLMELIDAILGEWRRARPFELFF